jgi:hypothetical protein
MKYSTSRPLVTLGSDVVTKKEYQDAVDYSYGASTLKRLVFAKLVEREAAKEGVVPTNADIDARIEDIRRRNPTLIPDSSDAFATAEFRQDVKNQLAIENLRMHNVNVSDAEVQDFYNAHQADFKIPAQVATTIVVCRNQVEANTAQTELQQGFSPDVIARNGLAVVGVNGFQINMQALPQAQRDRIQNSVIHLAAGSVEIVPADKYFVVIKVNKNDPAHIPALASIHDEVVRLVKLQKGPSQSDELASLYHDASPHFTVDKYRSYFADLETDNGRRMAQAQ